MNKTAAILSAESERAQLAAQVILCSLAAVCTVGVIWAVGQRSGSSAPLPPTLGSSAGADNAKPVFALPEVAQEPISSSPLAPQSFILPPPPIPGSALPSYSHSQSTAGLGTRPLAPTTLPSETPTAAKPVLPANRQLKNPQIIEAVETARLARQAGDTVSALESLRAADLREPQHPEILSEMALTYEALGRFDKAKGIWRAILASGEAQTGGYYAMAKSKLEDVPAPVAPLASSPIQLGTCQVVRDPLPTGGERVTVRVPIHAAPGAIIDPLQMDIHVFLFEQINDGERIEQVRADAPQNKWASEPVDWNSPDGEILEITYDLAAPTAEELRNLGNRSFHGYIVKLFYQDKLSGEQSQPPTLQDFPPRNSPAGLDNALFPK